MAHEMVEFDTEAKQRFRERSTPWVARWLLEKPSGQYFYPMLFRNELGQAIVHEAGLSMPNVEGGVRKLENLGLVVPIEAPKNTPNQLNFVPQIQEGWKPYLELWLDHVETHPGEIVVADTVTLRDVLQEQF